MRLGGPLLCVAALLAACASAPKPELSPEAKRLYDGALDLWLERDIRLQRISQRIRVHGADLCAGSQSAILGLVVTRLDAITPSLEEPARRRYGDGRVHVVAVLPGMPAEGAGVYAGDVLLAVNGREVDDKADVYQPDFVSAGSMTLTLERDGARLERVVESVQGCAFPAILVPSDAVNAAAGGAVRGYGGMARVIELPILVTSGLMRVMDRDEQVAVIVGHEIGHGLFFQAGGLDSGRRSEMKADYIGIYLAAMAGYEITLEDFGIIKLTYANPNRLTTGFSSSHPASPERELSFIRTLEEVRAKMANGEPLVPEIVR